MTSKRVFTLLGIISLVAIVVSGCVPTATPTPTPAATSTARPVLTPSPLPSPTPSTTATATRAPTATPSPTPQAESVVLTLAPDVTMDLVRVTAGPFLLGSADSDSEAAKDEKPQQMMLLDEYFIGDYEVTGEQFAAFVKAAGYRTSREVQYPAFGYDWQHPMDRGWSGRPVVWVSWDDATAFAKWAGQVTGWAVRLPTEAEWEKAARGTNGRKYPWGNEPPDATRCNFNSNVGERAPVGKYSPQGDSPYGAADMTGNVKEWTSSLYEPFPDNADDGRENASSRSPRVLRGGSFDSNARDVRSANRFSHSPGGASDNFGFRVAATRK